MPSRLVQPTHSARGTLRHSVLALALALLATSSTTVSSQAQAGASAPQGPAQDPVAVVRDCVKREMASRILGAQVAIARDGQLVMNEGFGRKHRDRPDLVDADTQFRIGSSTKMLTAAGMMRLVDRGLVDLDAPLSHYVPELRFAEPGAESRVTIRDLLQHTSGLPDNSVIGEADLYGKPDPTAMGRWVLSQGETKPHNPPGRFWNYSSANYMYAGYVIERVSGKSFQDFMKSEVFEPAGMHNTTMVASEVEARGNFAFGHWNDIFHGGVDIWKPTDQDNWARHPTGYAHSTASDLVRWATLLMDGGGKVLTPKSAQLMTSPMVFVHQRADQYYGFGVFSARHRSLDIKNHPGSAWGWMATVDWVPSEHFAVATLTNGFGTLYSSASCAIDAFLPSQSSPLPGGSCPQDKSSWTDFVGHYEGETYLGAALRFDVSLVAGVPTLSGTRADGKTFSTPMGQDCNKAYNDGPGSFTIDFDGNGTNDQTVTFIRDPVEPGLVWMRHRQFVLGRKGLPSAPTGTARPAETAVPTVTVAPTRRVTPTPQVAVFLPGVWR